MKCSNRDGEDDAGDDSLRMYFRDIAPLGVLTAEEERAAALDIAEKRRACWESALSYQPLLNDVIELIEMEGDGAKLPRAELDAARAASQDRRTGATSTVTLDEALMALAEKMAYADTDAVLMSLLRADLMAVLGGQEREVRLPVLEAQRGCEAVLTYARRVLADTSALDRATEGFVKANLRLVVSIARGYRYGPLSLQDLIQEGNIGLIKAIGRLDPRRGFRFSTYGSWWIRHAIGRAIADRGRDVRLPVHLVDRQFKLARARREFEKGHGRAPTDAELSALLKISEAKILLADRSLGVVSNLGAPINDDGTTLAELLRDEPDRSMAEELDLKVVRAQFLALLAVLTPIEEDIVRRRFGFDDDEMTLKDLGVRHSLSRERIRQLQEQALDKLGREIRRRGLLREWKLLMETETT
jgi:RNA polymerase primary sigma factor